jgi:hypothetical protein
MAEKTPPMMACGCAAQATMADGSPGCAVHGCTELAPEQPDLTGRTARCHDAQLRHRHSKEGQEVPSSLRLAFFTYRPDQEHDEYYCGCCGWD